MDNPVAGIPTEGKNHFQLCQDLLHTHTHTRTLTLTLTNVIQLVTLLAQLYIRAKHYGLLFLSGGAVGIWSWDILCCTQMSHTLQTVHYTRLLLTNASTRPRHHTPNIKSPRPVFECPPRRAVPPLLNTTTYCNFRTHRKQCLSQNTVLAALHFYGPWLLSFPFISSLPL